VRSGIRQAADDCWGGVEAAIELDPARFSAESFAGLDQFSHVEVLFLLHEVSPEQVVTGTRHPRGNSAWPKVGIFAQRGRARPNRIGSTVCRIVRVEGARVVVAELDAIDGTPVIDLKPYMSEFGPRSEVRQPEWSRESMRDYFKK